MPHIEVLKVHNSANATAVIALTKDNEMTFYPALKTCLKNRKE